MADVPFLVTFDREKVVRENVFRTLAFEARYFFIVFQSHAAFDFLSSR